MSGKGNTSSSVNGACSSMNINSIAYVQYSNTAAVNEMSDDWHI